jgi:esterase/lipase superfamily enzyme
VAKAPEVVEITTYYATNRNQTATAEPAKVYGVGFERTLHFGKAVVTIPLAHVAGQIELPKLWKLQREPDPNKHFVLKAVVPMDKDAVRREMQDRLDAGGTKSILMFVHGYYLSFPEAAMRTAQLAHDLKFAGVPFFYSWPSAAQLFSYWQDEETAELSEPLFEKLLDDLSQLPATDIYIVAHSMGNRIVSHALKGRVEQSKPTRHIREVLLAAPDINAELFRTVIAPKLAAMQGTRTTIYASSSDLALKASKIVHGFKRLGETDEGVFTYNGIDTIDASTATQVNRAYGHFYLMDSTLVLKDVRALIEENRAARDRGLDVVGKEPNIFYRLN